MNGWPEGRGGSPKSKAKHPEGKDCEKTEKEEHERKTAKDGKSKDRGDREKDMEKMGLMKFGKNWKQAL